ncbi:MAG: HD-GYP domain-containing protein [Treponema sp.]|jgi:HD-GYP domain-containing protein (c-di-GMP phosphodiesterase class II)|nr:HD-GYP domain-containing protein [Treponema sp.]
MTHTIDVKTLKPGIAFTAPVYIDADNLLVPAGIPLRKKDIDQLYGWGVFTVETEGEIQTETDKNAAPKNTGLNQLSLAEVQENRGPYRSYMGLIERLDTVFVGIAGGAGIEARSIDYITSQLLQEVRDKRDSFIGYILGGEVKGRGLAKSSINTAILSILIALELKLINHRVLQIATGALLHDVGMLRLPRSILNKKGSLSDAERQRIAAHPLVAHKIVTQELSYPKEVGFIVLQHHERWDGAGYPHRTGGTKIVLGARIVSVADAFEAMVSQKPYRNSMVGYQAMKNLLADNSRRFDPGMLRVFIKTMGIYPIGSIVLLNNSALARVVEVHADAPLRPKIHLLISEFGRIFKPDEGDIIDLKTDKTLFISKAVDPKDLAGKN